MPADSWTGPGGAHWLGRAPGKVILFGEHAVVYGRPAIAVPLTHLQAAATITPGPSASGIWLDAPDLPLFRSRPLAELPADDPLRAAVELALTAFGQPVTAGKPAPDLVIRIHSNIPVARGLGSGTAVTAAILRAMAAYYHQAVMPEQLSPLVYDIEKLHHGTPSGIDNTVVVYEQPIYFRRGADPAHLRLGRSLRLLVADSGVPSSTRRVVEHVRQCWQAQPERYERLFDDIGTLVQRARDALVQGQLTAIGALMNENQRLLTELGVSSAELERLVSAARTAGALGAKLSGAGWGGCMLALVEPPTEAPVAKALRSAGAVAVMASDVG